MAVMTTPTRAADPDIERTRDRTRDRTGDRIRDRIRGQFPALAGDTIYFDNAGGSQVPRCVADAVHRYLLESYVQLGAGYAMSQRCTKVVDDAHAFVNLFMNGTATGKVVLGASSTHLVMMLVECYRRALPRGSEIIVSEIGHEANVGPWMKLADEGFIVKVWEAAPRIARSLECPLEALEGLLTERTRIVALPHVSNLLGRIEDIQGAIRLAHSAGARVVVDGVAYASHRAMDVAAWDADWYLYGPYKVYGPHMGAMYGKAEAFDEITGPNHFFIPRAMVPYKFEPGGVCHEACAGLLALGEYLKLLAGREDEGECERATIERAFEVMTALELPLQERLIEYLNSKPGATIIGPATAGPSRVPTISFVHESVPSADIVKAICAANIGARHGHMYTARLCAKLGYDLNDGFARVSMVHYNTLEEVERLIEVLNGVLP